MRNRVSRCRPDSALTAMRLASRLACAGLAETGSTLNGRSQRQCQSHNFSQATLADQSPEVGRRASLEAAWGTVLSQIS